MEPNTTLEDGTKLWTITLDDGTEVQVEFSICCDLSTMGKLFHVEGQPEQQVCIPSPLHLPHCLTRTSWTGQLQEHTMPLLRHQKQRPWGSARHAWGDLWVAQENPVSFSKRPGQQDIHLCFACSSACH